MTAVLSLSSEKITNQQAAEALLKYCDGQTIAISSVESKEKCENPPKLYDLTTLQREANRKLGFAVQPFCAQNLYEKKLITYPRTDSRYLTLDMSESIPAATKKLQQGVLCPKALSFLYVLSK